MTANGKGSMGDLSLEMQNINEGFNTRANYQTCVRSNGPVSDGEEETLAWQV